jgi:hypothetical protein
LRIDVPRDTMKDKFERGLARSAANDDGGASSS